MICDISNKKIIRVGDRFVAGNYCPPIIFEATIKTDGSTVYARSVVVGKIKKPDFVGKCLIITKNQKP